MPRMAILNKGEIMNELTKEQCQLYQKALVEAAKCLALRPDIPAHQHHIELALNLAKCRLDVAKHNDCPKIRKRAEKRVKLLKDASFFKHFTRG